jgi:SAM-dependent methyltransferase
LTSHTTPSHYQFKPGRFSSHGRILAAARTWPRSHRILEIGTATGYLGRELGLLGFRELAGVESDAASAQVAREHYRWFAVADLEHDVLPDDIRECDVLICADVLEHLRDPLAQLRTLLTRVKPGASVVVSLPNVAHWTVRLSLLAGRFSYTDRGLLDRSHLRFFTLRSARALIEEAGCRIERCDPTPIPLALVLAPFVPSFLAQWAEAAYTALTLLWRTLFAYQFVFVARAPMAAPPAPAIS